MTRRSPEWLLIETFGHLPATVIGRGSTTKSFIPIHQVIRSSTHRAVVETALMSITSGTAVPQDFIQSGVRYIFLPLTDFAGHTQAVLVHYGDPDVPVKPPPKCGAWHFNTNSGEASGSCELLNMYGTPEHARRNARPMHEAFERLVGNDPEATKKLIQKHPGSTHQATETVRADDCSVWIASYSCRFVTCTNEETHLHGVTRMVGSYCPSSNAPNPFDLAHQVADAERQPDVYRTIIDPTTGNLLRSYDPYLSRTHGLRNIFELLDDRDDIDTMRRLIYLCAHDQVPLRSLVSTDNQGRPIDFDLLPIDAAGITAVFGVFQRSS